MKINLSAIKKRVAALEQTAALRGGDGAAAELLSPRDVAFLLVERRNLEEQNGVESAILAARIGDLLKSHERAILFSRPKAIAPNKATEAFSAATARTEEDEERYRHGWHGRLEAMPTP